MPIAPTSRRVRVEHFGTALPPIDQLAAPPPNPVECAGCLGRRKGTACPSGMGLRPTLPRPGGCPDFRRTSVAARCASGCDDLLILHGGGDGSGDLGVERGAQLRQGQVTVAPWELLG